MLTEEIEKAQRLVKTDAYQMSIGEIVSMYEEREIVIDPEFQRLFRWNISQKSKLICSRAPHRPLDHTSACQKVYDSGSVRSKYGRCHPKSSKILSRPPWLVNGGALLFGVAPIPPPQTPNSHI